MVAYEYLLVMHMEEVQDELAELHCLRHISHDAQSEDGFLRDTSHDLVSAHLEDQWTNEVVNA